MGRASAGTPSSLRYRWQGVSWAEPRTALGPTVQVQLTKLVLPFPATEWNTAKRRQCGVNATRLPGFLSRPAVVPPARSGGAS